MVASTIAGVLMGGIAPGSFRWRRKLDDGGVHGTDARRYDPRFGEVGPEDPDPSRGGSGAETRFDSVDQAVIVHRHRATLLQRNRRGGAAHHSPGAGVELHEA